MTVKEESAAFPDIVVSTEAGKVRGRIADGAVSFLGIPYAAAPIGSLRFQAPQPHGMWDGIRDCSEYGPTAPQPVQRMPLIPEPLIDGDEYLNLNIFAPADASKAPVIVWIHGGGFISGCNRSPWFRGHRFAQDGVILVAINYRLGAEGFMPMRGAPGNRGVLDWIAALRWVGDNISAFGGDPANVTIAGQSAGAIACTYLATIPEAKGLFHRLIGMSGSIGFGMSEEAAGTIAATFREALGVSDDAAEMAAVPISRFIETQAKIGGGGEGGELPMPNVIAGQMGQGLLFQPVIDGELITQSAARSIVEGAGADIPMMLSCTAHEFDFTTAIPDIPYTTDDLAVGLGLLGFVPQDIEAYTALRKDLSPTTAIGRAVSDKYFRARTVEMAEIRISAPQPTFLSEFHWSPSPPVPGAFGACHCIDVPFAFDVLDDPNVPRFCGNSPPRNLATRLHSSFVDFAKRGDPGWAPYREGSRLAMVFDASTAVWPDPFQGERAVWSKLSWVRA
jgi:para-nitrobenzyl esterase